MGFYGLLIFIPVFYSVYIAGFLFYSVLFIAIFIAGYEYNNLCGRWSFALDGMVLTSFIIFATTVVFIKNSAAKSKVNCFLNIDE